jgi:hypothetical protein
LTISSHCREQVQNRANWRELQRFLRRGDSPMKIALAALILCPALLAAGCQQKKAEAATAPNPILGEWACALTTDSAKVKFVAVFAADKKSTIDVTLNASAAGKRIAGKLSGTGKWSQKGKTLALTFGDFKVAYATTNGEKSSDNSVTSLVRDLGIEGKELAIETLSDTELAYAAKAGTVSCTR